VVGPHRQWLEWDVRPAPPVQRAEPPRDAPDGSGLDFHRLQEDDTWMNPGVGTGLAWGSSVGYLVVLLGAAVFVASCFVPYYGFEGPAQRTFSLYEQLTAVDGGFPVGRLLYMFAGVAIAASIAVVGVVRSERQPRVPSLLIGAVAAWSLPWIGGMLAAAQTSLGLSFEVGYWVQAVSIGVVITGTIVVMASGTSKDDERDET
jgi:hypothetical protein